MADPSKFHVKNRAPAPIQITAEQILREAKDRKIEVEVKVPRQHITNEEELRVFRMRKRKEFEDGVRQQRANMGGWVKYAVWEESQKELERARSIFERALDVDYKGASLWVRYAEMEMRNKYINHARNVWDRAVTLLPRVDQLWYKYAYMEEMLGELDKARTVFERWMEWEPDDNAWTAFVKFEMRRQRPDRARALLERYATSRPSARSFLKWAKWEEQQGQLALARAVYERAVAELPDGERGERLFIAFAQFEERCKEDERARVIYKYALDQGTREEMPELHRAFVAFEKRHGTVGEIEEAVVSRRRLQYEEEVAKERFDYDAWFDYIRLEEAGGDLARIREVYERAIANVPPVREKRFWRRYIFLWISYAVFEELQARDASRARDVYNACLKIIPHKEFTFAKVWLLLAKLELRQKDVDAARKVLGRAIGMCPKGRLFKGYIDLEEQLGEADRVRKVYAKYLETFPYNCQAWLDFAQLEGQTYGEEERARSVLELAISQALEEPERAWKAYIDFEVALGDIDRARELYERLLGLTQHTKAWISYARFEASTPGALGLAAARKVLRRAYDSLRRDGLKEERVRLLEEWRDVEREGGDKAALGEVEKMMPRRFKKKKMVLGDAGEEMGWEEYYDYKFPDDETAPANLRILEMAQKWKEAQLRQKQQGSELPAEQEREQASEEAADDETDVVAVQEESMEVEGVQGAGGKRKASDAAEEEEEGEGEPPRKRGATQRGLAVQQLEGPDGEEA